MIQFDYEHSAFFGDHMKVIIEDGQLRYRKYTVDFPGREEWKSPEVVPEKINEFLDWLENLESCIESYGTKNIKQGRSYRLVCRTERITKTIRGYQVFQPSVQFCIDKMISLHPELEDDWEY